MFSKRAKQPETLDEIREKVRKRMARLDVPARMDWVDSAGSAVALSLKNFRYERDPMYLQESLVALRGMVATVELTLEEAER